jgi:hypothetical protein
MKFRAFAIAAVFALMSGTAFARHCPADMAKIDAALAAKPKLSDAELSEVKKLRAEGEALHNNGKHLESEEALAKALLILAPK